MKNHPNDFLFDYSTQCASKGIISWLAYLATIQEKPKQLLATSYKALAWAQAV